MDDIYANVPEAVCYSWGWMSSLRHWRPLKSVITVDLSLIRLFSLVLVLEWASRELWFGLRLPLTTVACEL